MKKLERHVIGETKMDKLDINESQFGQEVTKVKDLTSSGKSKVHKKLAFVHQASEVSPKMRLK